MTDAELVEAIELAEAAIDAPWTVRRDGGDTGAPPSCTVLDGNGMWVAKVGRDPKSADFIARARTLVPALVDEIYRLRGERIGPVFRAVLEKATLETERDAYRAMLADLLASAHPHPVEHPTMTAQWARARKLLKDGPPRE